MSDEWIDDEDVPTAPMDWPQTYWDPTTAEHRLGKLALGRFVVSNLSTYVYERFIAPTNLRPAGQKTFLLIPMGGVEGAMLDAPEWGPGDFKHARYQAILRVGSLRNWWGANTTDDVDARFLYTSVSGLYVGLERYGDST